MLLWRNHPGEDPDTDYVWWHSGELTNFGKINDPEIDRLLERDGPPPTRRAGRRPTKAITKEFAKNIWNVWAWYVDWGIATRPDVHGILGPSLPDGSKPFPILAGLHPTVGIWVSNEGTTRRPDLSGTVPGAHASPASSSASCSCCSS